MKKPTRIKAPALKASAPQSVDECAAAIRALGDKQRERLRIETAMNDALADVTARFQPELEAMKKQIEQDQAGIQAFCEAHRDELTHDGKTKTAGFVTGEVQWRQRPPSCRVTKPDAVIEFLKRVGLGRFVRVKEEVNKDAILNEPAAVQGVAGITIVTGAENFVITPFEQEAV